MRVQLTEMPDLRILEPTVFPDERGFFFESFRVDLISEDIGSPVNFVQDNHSFSRRGVLRGLHYQQPHAQGKLVSVCAGEIWDVAVDLRRSSPTFGCWNAVVLSAENKLRLWIPEGFAHGFLVLSDGADVQYKITDFRHPDSERCIAWNDPDLAIEWPLTGNPVMSEKDRKGAAFKGAPCFD